MAPKMMGGDGTTHRNIPYCLLTAMILKMAVVELIQRLLCLKIHMNAVYPQTILARHIKDYGGRVLLSKQMRFVMLSSE